MCRVYSENQVVQVTNYENYDNYHDELSETINLL